MDGFLDYIFEPVLSSGFSVRSLPSLSLLWCRGVATPSVSPRL